jgi:hypothetical protein
VVRLSPRRPVNRRLTDQESDKPRTVPLVRPVDSR